MTKPYEIVAMVGDRDETTGRWSTEYAICFDGIQWAPPGFPRDASGAGDFTCATREEAEEWAQRANEVTL